MDIKGKFDHFNINVTDLEKSIRFYRDALGLRDHRRKEASDGSFVLVYLTDSASSFLLELLGSRTIPNHTNWARTKAICVFA